LYRGRSAEPVRHTLVVSAARDLVPEDRNGSTIQVSLP